MYRISLTHIMHPYVICDECEEVELRHTTRDKHGNKLARAVFFSSDDKNGKLLSCERSLAAVFDCARSFLPLFVITAIQQRC